MFTPMLLNLRRRAVAEVATVETATMEVEVKGILRSVTHVTAPIVVTVNATFSDAIGQNIMVIQEVTQEEIW